MDAAALYQRHAGAIRRALRCFGVRAEDGDDLVQEVFLVAHRRGGFEPIEARPLTWLTEIALRIASAEGRRRRRSRETFDEDAVAQARAGAASPAEELESAELRGVVLAALESLDIDQRALLISFELEGQACESLAQTLGVPVGTVYSRLHTARRALARRIHQPLFGAP